MHFFVEQVIVIACMIEILNVVDALIDKIKICFLLTRNENVYKM